MYVFVYHRTYNTYYPGILIPGTSLWASTINARTTAAVRLYTTVYIRCAQSVLLAAFSTLLLL